MLSARLVCTKWKEFIDNQVWYKHPSIVWLLQQFPEILGHSGAIWLPPCVTSKSSASDQPFLRSGRKRWRRRRNLNRRRKKAKILCLWNKTTF